jgi:hypothetical protein
MSLVGKITLIVFPPKGQTSMISRLSAMARCGRLSCYASPTHEFLGFSSGLDFENKIMVKEHAPQLLHAEFPRRNGNRK